MASAPKLPPHPDCVPLFAEARGDIEVSFEFFPPKTDKMEATLWESIQTLAPLSPRFVSVTYGAGGSTRDRTLRMVSQIKTDTGVDAAAHLTCVGATREEVDAVVRGYQTAGISRIVALRGDSPAGVGMPFVQHPGGYTSAATQLKAQALKASAA
jgi:methylenetetrahydrofolate reductase (NADPH)